MIARICIAVAAICFCVSGALAAAHPSKRELKKRAASAAAYVTNIYADLGPGASFAISYNGEILASGATGFADLEWNAPLTADTMLRLGSISKPVTAIAALALVEDGKLDLDAPVRIYDPALPATIGAVTLRQLMSHRSGLAEHVWNPDILPFIWQPMTTEQVIALQKDKPYDFQPGEKYNYVNFNYVVVAHVIEKVAGKTYVEFIDDYFAAHDMTHSRYDVHDAILASRAEFYDRPEEGPAAGSVVNAADVDLSHVSAAGALLASAKDMALWAKALSNGELVSPAMLKDAWTPAPLPDGTPTQYGLGFNVREFCGARMIWHNGMTPGGQGAFVLMPEAGVFAIVLSNGFTMPNTTRASRAIAAAMLTGDPQAECAAPK